jgi:hypothetical protein
MSEINSEKKTLIVILLTLVTMFAEIIVGYLTNSMALFADGCHMGTHALALSITFLTYVFIEISQILNCLHLVQASLAYYQGLQVLFYLVLPVFLL